MWGRDAKLKCFREKESSQFLLVLLVERMLTGRQEVNGNCSLHFVNAISAMENVALVSTRRTSGTTSSARFWRENGNT